MNQWMNNKNQIYIFMTIYLDIVVPNSAYEYSILSRASNLITRINS